MVLNRREVSALFFPFLMRLQVSYDQDGPRATENIAWGSSFQKEIRAAVRDTRKIGVITNPLNGKWIDVPVLLLCVLSTMAAVLNQGTGGSYKVTILFGFLAVNFLLGAIAFGAMKFNETRERYTIHLLDTAQAYVLQRNPSHWTVVEAPYDGK